MLNNGWGYFEETGNIDAYLLYLEYKRLVDGEYSDFKAETAGENERKDTGFDFEGD